MRRRKNFACGSSVLVRVEYEGGTAAWLSGCLVAPSVQGHGLPPPQELWPNQSYIEPFAAGDQKACLGCLSPLLYPFRHLEGLLPGDRGAPLAGVLLCTSVHQALEGAPWVGPTL